MRRPDWFNCKACLFFDKEVRLCMSEPEAYETRQNAWCSKWTCANCWRDWDTEDWARDTDLNDYWFVDHSNCKPAKIGEEEG